jgi:hypothetical protein
MATYLVYYRDGSKQRFAANEFSEAARFFREHGGYALRNEERACDGESEFGGLTSEEREQVEP